MTQPMSESTAVADQPWHRKLDATQWKTLLASNLGWVFDGFEAYQDAEKVDLLCGILGIMRAA
jgi:hypothetical protein